MTTISTNGPRGTLTVEETARYLGISRNSAYAGVKSGDIRSVRVGARILIPRAALQKLLIVE